MATEKQKLARHRNYFLWRISGITIPEQGLTEFEKGLVQEIKYRLKLLKLNFDHQSRLSGLNVKIKDGGNNNSTGGH